MSWKPRRRKCRCCRTFFDPDYRNAHHQHYCSAPACRQASKQASQRRWAHQFANRSHFRGEHEVRRVQEWRRSHPGYWKKPKVRSPKAQVADPQPVNLEQRSRNVPPSDLGTLQDFCLAQDPAFVGLISMVTGSTLQEDIAQTTRTLQLKGQNILGLKIPGQLGSTTTSSTYEKTSDSTGSPPPGASRL
jgi:hypothetical protein